MLFTELELKGAYVLDLERFEDSRGFFARTWGQDLFEERGLSARIAQANMSFNHTQGTLRGMHFQKAPYAESKLVRCVRGAIYDVIIDLRPGSHTYTRWAGVELTAENRRSVYVPEGFAHGFLTLEDNCEVFYQVSQVYTPGAEGGVRYNDPAFDIQWPQPVTIMSEKDQRWPEFSR
jgi:dTDP-4-dehydrorhamnose 3,5-epimerase